MFSLAKGSTLLTCLVMLALLSMAALAGMQRSNLQLRVVGNLQYQQEVFNVVHNHLQQFQEQLNNPQVAQQLEDILVLQEVSNSNLIPSTTQQNLSISNHIRVLEQPSSTQTYNAQRQQGNSVGIFVQYRFASTVHAQDAQGHTHSQEVGIGYLVAAQP